MVATAWQPAPEGLGQILQLLRVNAIGLRQIFLNIWFQESQSPDTVTQRLVQRRLEELNQVSSKL